ncbi:MAG: hypothetical protein ACRCSS_11430 [Shewanella sp.]
MAKFWITIALLFSLFSQSTIVKAMPTPAINDLFHSHCMQMADDNINCVAQDGTQEECMIHCQDSLTNHCKTHCLAKLFITSPPLPLVLMSHASKLITSSSWAIQTAELGLTTPPPNSDLL